MNASREINLQCSTDSIIDLRNASEEQLSSMFYNETDKYIICICFTLLFIIGLVGNVGFLMVVALVDEMRTKTNFYLANLAIADLIFIAAEVYENLLTYLISPVVKSLIYNTPFGCGVMFTAIYGSHFTSVAILFLVALERYFAICKPLKHRVIVAGGRTVKLIACSWVFGFVYAATLVSPRYFVVQESCIFWPEDEQFDNLPTKTIGCVPVHPAYNAFPNIVQSFPYALALAACVYMYAIIIKNLSTRLPDIEKSDSNQASEFNLKARQVRNQVARLLVANAAVFFVCHFPHFFLRFNDALLTLSDGRVGINIPEELWYALYWVTRAMGTANSVANPMIYLLTNARYRHAFWVVFTCKWNNPKARLYSEKSSVSTTNM